MTQYKIGPGNSIFSTTVSGIADPGNLPPLPNSLTVDPGGFIISTADNGADLSGNFKVTVNGVIGSTAPSRSGIYMRTPTLATASTISIGLDGEVFAQYGIVTEHKANIINKGTISGSAFDGIVVTELADGDFTITNNGVIDSAFGIGILLRSTAIDHPLGIHTIVNNGTIRGATYSISTGTFSAASTAVEKVTNSGKLFGDVDLGGGNDVLVNSGTITNNVIMGSATPEADSITNSGAIFGDIFFGGGADTLSNSGTLLEDLAISDGNDTITNSGVLAGSLYLNGGNNSVTNSGKIIGGLYGGSGTDKVATTGMIEDGIYLGDGDDSLTGGNQKERVFDGNGADTVVLGAGDDIYHATGATGVDLNDHIDGGTGTDTYVAVLAAGAVYINLDISDHSYPSGVFVAAKTANGVDVGGASYKDTIIGFEHASGGDAGDSIYGSATANTLYGGKGSDTLLGHAGNDWIEGGQGVDNILGGMGRDTLIGGSEADFFVYLSIKESGITKATRDTIADFDPASDLIDLFAIDAKSNNAAGTNDDFTFIGTNKSFDGIAGQLRAYWNTDGQIIEGDVNGDRKADFSIQLTDPAHAILLNAGHFIGVV